MLVDRNDGGTFQILTVCVGNICRSPLAERLLSKTLAEHSLGQVEVVSAGTRGLVGRSIDSHAARELSRLGGVTENFAARRLSSEQILSADLVLAMTRAVRAEVLKEQPRAMKRTFTLLEFAHLCRLAVEDDAPISSIDDLIAFAARHRSRAAGVEQDVPDPIAQSPRVHQEVADLIAANIDVVTAVVVPFLRRAGDR